jgi:hypothetical protein
MMKSVMFKRNSVALVAGSPIKRRWRIFALVAPTFAGLSQIQRIMENAESVKPGEIHNGL